jgi:DNA-binding response OmpR family regulator
MSYKILSVEDSTTMQRLLTSIFSEFFIVHGEKNGQTALDWIKGKNEVDLIITDLNMPTMGGYELLTILKADERYKAIPIIVLSNNKESSEKIKLLKSGADDYVEKPFNPEELFWRVTNIIKRVKK